MADKIVIQLDLETGDTKTAFGDLEDKAKKAGEESGEKFSKEFKRETNGNLLSDFNKNILGSLGSITKAAAVAGAAIAGIAGFTVFKSIGAAREQEDAVNRLNGALRASGSFSTESSEDLQAFASELQKVTTIGDETALSQLALAKGFGASNDQAKAIVSGAADLAVALGQDLESATRNISKTLGGLSGELGEVITELKNLTQEQLKSGAAIDLIAQKFQGLAQNETQTFSGALAQAGNAFGDLFEEIGAIITQNPIIIKGLNEIGKVFVSLGNQVKSFASTFNIFDDLINPLLNINNALINNVAAPLEFVANIGSIVFNTLVSGVSTVVAAFGFLGGKIAEFLNKFGIAKDIAEGLQTFAETSAESAAEAAQRTSDGLASALDFPVSSTLATKNEELRTFFQEQRSVIQEESALTKEVLNNNIAEQAEVTTTFGQLAIDTFGAVSIQAEQTKEAFANTVKQTASIIKGGLVKSVSGGIQNIVTSLANGENAFANFGKFLLSTFGDLAIQLGTFFISQGIAVEALNAVSGTGAIAAGAALVALGSILKSFSGSGGSSSSATSNGAAAGGLPQDAQSNFASSGVAEPQQARAEQQSQVTINVDRFVGEEEEARRFTEIISEAGAKNGLLLTDIRGFT